MSVKIARNSGFCFGVKRAIKIALEATQKENDIVTLGPIIHNPQMVRKLENKGVHKVEDITDINGRSTIIRSHGVKKEIMERLNREGIEVINATCPYVSKTQQVAKELHEKGFQVIIMGDKDHPEVIALRSYVDGDVIIVNKARQLLDQKFKKVGIISQTTKQIEDLEEIVKVLISRSDELYVVNTICNATTVRQSSTVDLAKESDLMIVIGGKNSSNTKMLAKICRKFVETYHIETESEIDSKWFNGMENIGITAGASTPDWIIVEVYNKINKCMGDTLQVDNIDDIPDFKEE
jgi:(E)-4-hydroxy-3-methyl-but-2-enyl pyrophosphate reductase